MTRSARDILATLEGTTGTYTQLGYRTVRTAHAERRHAVGGSGERHMTFDRMQLINQSRQFMRDNGIYRGMILRAVNYIVGNGFTLQAKTKPKRLNAKIEALWKEYWRRPVITRRMSGRQAERMVCRELFVAGDVGAIKTTDAGTLQLIESEQIVGKKELRNDGMVRDRVGRATGYWVSGWGRGGQVDLRTARRYDPQNFLFLADPDRPSSARGVPPAQASFPMLHRINDVCDSEALAWQLLARLALSVTRDEAGARAFGESTADSDATGTEMAMRVQEIGYALLFHARPGDEIKGIERNIPGKDFGASVTMFLRLLGLPLGLPLEIILLDWTKSNYSQSRAVLEQAYVTFLAWQMLLADFFMEPVYRWQLARWVKQGLVPDREDIAEHAWLMPTFPWLDKLKEAQAYGEQIDRGMTTLGQVCKGLKQDRVEVIDAREAEILDAIARAQAIEKKTGVSVPWQILAGMKSETATKPAAPAGGGDEGERTDDEDETADDERTDDDETAEDEESDA